MSSSCPVPITQTDRVLLGHGSGGKLTAQLVEQLIVPAFSNPALAHLDDPRNLAVAVAFTLLVGIGLHATFAAIGTPGDPRRR